MSKIYGLVIAGGKGTRLGGVSKATLRLGNVRVLDRVAAALAPCARPLLVATGPKLAVYPLPPGTLAIADLPDGLGGPMAALRAAAHWLEDGEAREGLLMTAAVDAPLLPDDYVARMVDTLGDGDAVQAVWRDCRYPTHAAWRIPVFLRLVNEGEFTSPKSLLGAANTYDLDWSRWTDEDPFSGLNTLDDLVRLGRCFSVVSYSQRTD